MRDYDRSRRNLLLSLLTVIEEVCGDRAELAGMRLAATRAALVGYLQSARKNPQKIDAIIRAGIRGVSAH
jgi:hypothetical protein